MQECSVVGRAKLLKGAGDGSCRAHPRSPVARAKAQRVVGPPIHTRRCRSSLWPQQRQVCFTAAFAQQADGATRAHAPSAAAGRTTTRVQRDGRRCCLLPVLLVKQICCVDKMQQQHFGVAPELAPAPAPPLPGGDGDDGAGGAIGDQQQRAAAVKALLDEARAALAANSAPRALELVVAALQRLGGGAAVGPALRAAVEAFRGQQQAQHQQHQQQQAPRIDELAALLAQVSLAAAASCEQQQQQQTPWPPPSQPHPFGAHAAPAWPLPQQQPQQQQLLGHQQQQQPQPWPPPPPQPLPQPAAAAAAILEETGRGGLAAAAMADGSSGACPHCGGVLPRERMQAHLELWCPALGSRAH